MTEIERMLKRDSIEKKRIGRGVFSRKASVKGSRVHKLNTTSANMTPSQIKKLSGEVKTYNMNDLMTYEEFLKLDEAIQKETFKHWRKKYSVAKIKQGLGIKATEYYKLANKFKIESSRLEAYKYRNKTEISKEELIKVKESGEIDYEQFLKLTREQQAYLIFSWKVIFGKKYLKCFTNKRDNIKAYITSNVLYRIKKKYGASNIEQTIISMIEGTNIEDDSCDNMDDLDTIEASIETRALNNKSYETATDREVEIPAAILFEKDETDINESKSFEENCNKAINNLNLCGTFKKEIIQMLIDKLDENELYDIHLSINVEKSKKM